VRSNPADTDVREAGGTEGALGTRDSSAAAREDCGEAHRYPQCGGPTLEQGKNMRRKEQQR